jgi:hypothetical protein
MFLLRQRSGEPAARQRRTVPPVVMRFYLISVELHQSQSNIHEL